MLTDSQQEVWSSPKKSSFEIFDDPQLGFWNSTNACAPTNVPPPLISATPEMRVEPLDDLDTFVQRPYILPGDTLASPQRKYQSISRGHKSDDSAFDPGNDSEIALVLKDLGGGVNLAFTTEILDRILTRLERIGPVQTLESCKCIISPLTCLMVLIRSLA